MEFKNENIMEKIIRGRGLVRKSGIEGIISPEEIKQNLHFIDNPSYKERLVEIYTKLIYEPVVKKHSYDVL